MPDADIIPVVAKMLNVSTDWILTGEDTNNRFNLKEERLLDFYRRASPEGQDRILEQAEFYAQRYPVKIINLQNTGTE